MYNVAFSIVRHPLGKEYSVGSGITRLLGIPVIIGIPVKLLFLSTRDDLNCAAVEHLITVATTWNEFQLHTSIPCAKSRTHTYVL